MPLNQGSSRQAISGNIRQLLAEGKPRQQAIAIALDTQRRAKAKARVRKGKCKCGGNCSKCKSKKGD